MRTEGWQKVLGFTLVQHIKTKSFIISTVIMCVIIAAVCVLTNILPSALGADKAIENAFGGGEDKGGFSSIRIIDNSGILTDDDFTYAAKSGFSLTVTDDEESSVIERLSKSEAREALIVVNAEKDVKTGTLAGYNIKSYFTKAGGKGSADELASFASNLVERRTLFNAGVTEETYADTLVYYHTQVLEAGVDELNFAMAILNYAVPMVVSLVLFILIFLYGNTVAQSIATEKTSRVMELLLTSVRPLAVVIGKVLAMGIVSFGQFMLFGTVGAVSFLVSAPFGFLGNALKLMADPAFAANIADAAEAVGAAGVSGAGSADVEIAQALSALSASITPLNIILIIIIFLLGFLFFSLLAALVGASISRMEDLQTAMTPYSLSGVLGLYLAYFPVIFNIDALEQGSAATNPVQVFSYYFPLSSPFALPSAILLGSISPINAVIATLVLAAMVVLIAIVVSKVYEAIILHNGSRIKFGDILKMAMRK